MSGGLHTLPVGHEVLAVWRMLFWLAAVLVLGQLIGDALGRGGLHSTRLVRAAVIVFIVRSVVVQALRWDEPGYWEGLPVDTLALALAAVGVWFYRQPDEDEARDTTGVPRRFR